QRIDDSSGVPTAYECESCGSSLSGSAGFVLRDARERKVKCARCSLVDARLIRRSSVVALVVGTCLVGLNHGDRILAGTFSWSTDWFRVALTYVVPFCVSTYGSLANGYEECLGSSSPRDD
ncbi:MAG: nitrate/nitrite transporter NrtS, partial [Planctomycetota bacterium]